MDTHATIEVLLEMVFFYLVHAKGVIRRTIKAIIEAGSPWRSESSND
jgi:hypothetical protein